MTTLEERREWMRRGCPDDWPPVKPRKRVNVRCDLFRLKVKRNGYASDIVATCQACEEQAKFSVVEVDPDTGPQLSVAPGVAFLAGWMTAHAVASGMPLDRAAEIFGVRVKDSAQVEFWAEQVSIHGRDDENSGLLQSHLGLKGLCPPSGEQGVILEAEAA